MRFYLPVCASLLLATPSLTAQNEASARDSARVLLLEHRFGPDSAESIVVNLERRVVYWAELTGPGTPAFLPLRRRPRPAFLVPIAAGPGDEPQRFEVYAIQAGSHRVSLADLPPGTVATLRLYQDVFESQRIAEKLDRQLAVGLTLASGFHSGYRLDPTGGADPDGGTDVEGCLLAEAGGRFGACIGVGRQSFPDAGFTATWLFLEQQSRLISGRLLGDRRTDLGAAVRYSHAIRAGPRNQSPGLLGFGLYVTQHFAPEGRRRGWRIHCAWQHGRLGNAIETERLDTDRFTAGITWIP